MPHVADLLAAAAGKAQGEVSDMGLALQYVGPIATGMGISLEETAGSIALLASNGILGEKAGTGLRGVLASLTGPSAKARRRWTSSASRSTTRRATSSASTASPSSCSGASAT